MSVESLAIVLHHSRAKGTAKVVLLGIANHDGDGGAWPTVDTLARYANCTRRAVQDALNTLEKLSEVRRIYQAGGDHNIADHRRPNRYQILLECPSTCDRSKHHRTTHELVFDDVSTGVKPASPHEVGFTGGGEVGFTQTVPLNSTTKTSSVSLDPAARAKAILDHCILPWHDHEYVGGICIHACGAYASGRVEDTKTGHVLIEAVKP